MDFNPRAPYGARQYLTRVKLLSPVFQSSRPLRGATFLTAYPTSNVPISILAPLTGRDQTPSS